MMPTSVSDIWKGILFVIEYLPNSTRSVLGHEGCIKAECMPGNLVSEILQYLCDFIMGFLFGVS